MNIERINEIEKKFTNKTIAIIGDMMLDGYFWGDVTRVSPEAPVPVVEIENEFFRFGGAANVALNISSIGGNPLPIGIIGNDRDGKTFLSLMDNADLNSDGIFFDKQRPTTTKTRVIAGKQHVVRIDKESKDPINNELEMKILQFLESNISEIDAIILETEVTQINKLPAKNPFSLFLREFTPLETIFNASISKPESVSSKMIETPPKSSSFS